MKMKVAVFLAVAFTAACCVLAVPTPGKKKGKEMRVRAATSVGSLNDRPNTADGQVTFRDEVDVALNIEGREEKKAKLKKVEVGPENPALASKMNQRTAVYANDDDTVVCRKECDDSGDCDGLYCIEHEEDQSCYISGGMAACMDSEPVALVDMIKPEVPGTYYGVNPTMVFNTIVRSLFGVDDFNTIVRCNDETFFAKANRSSRRRRSLFPDMQNSGIIRVIYHPDAAFMELFKEIAGGNATDAMTEVTKYLKLVSNEMTISYQSMKAYNFDYTLKKKSYTLAFVVYLAHIEFPLIYDNEFINVAWSQLNLDECNKLPPVNTITTFAFFIQTYAAPVGVDHHAAITGFGLAGSTAGIAFFETLCQIVYKLSGMTTSLTEQFPLMATVLAHELGHNFGANHDGGGLHCEELKYLMSAFVPLPTALNKNSYFRFSICSAYEIKSYLSGIRRHDLDPECLVNSGVSDEEYFEDFCLGFRGTGMTLEEICQAGYGETSIVCYDPLAGSGYVDNCLNGYGCTLANGACTLITEVPPGTKCTNDTTLGNKICFEGECVEVNEICPDAPPCYCTTRRCCRASGPPCCSGCSLNPRGICTLI